MSLFRRSTAIAETRTPLETGFGIDRSRFHHLLETSLRLRDLGVDFETIRRRAELDGVSMNDALEAIDREHTLE